MRVLLMDASSGQGAGFYLLSEQQNHAFLQTFVSVSHDRLGFMQACIVRMQGLCLASSGASADS